MIRRKRSVLRRALDTCRVALGVRSGYDPMHDVEAAADEVRDRLALLQREYRMPRRYPYSRSRVTR